MPAVDSILAKPTVLFVVGPTASGKTAAALAIVIGNLIKSYIRIQIVMEFMFIFH